MKNRVRFVFGIHNHQPVGNFDHTFEFAYSHSYDPFLKTLERHPSIRMALHMPGILWEWVEEKHPDFIDRVRELVASDQLELMSGGYYEPILSILSDSDKIGQIKKLTEYLSSRFGVEPQGMWVAERVWEPQYAKPISQAGMRYVCLDDSHFKMTGLKTSDLYGHYMTEEDGHSLAVFPIDMQMRYLVPFKPVEKILDYLATVATPFGERVVVLADDGEKFGVWPGTYGSVYKEGWLERFFTALEENADWIQMVLFSEHLADGRSCGNVYLPTASYTEMMEWVLPAEDTIELEEIIEQTEREGHENYQRFLKGGFWRNYLVKYPESNNMHKKMLYVHKKVDRMPKAKRQQALDRLWAGQCNCAYWHGVFGGLYLNHLRAAVYANLIRAENLADAALRKQPTTGHFKRTDFLCDGSESLVLENSQMNVYLDLSRGGRIFEWDMRKTAFNLANTLSRRKVAYHRKVIELARIEEQGTTDVKGEKSIHEILKAKEKGLEKHLVYDWYRRSILVDHFLGVDVSLEGFRKCKYEEQGDFIIEPYECRMKRRKDFVTALLERRGHLYQHGQCYPLHVRKVICFPQQGTKMQVKYEVQNTSDSAISCWFGVESNFSLQAGNTPDRYYVLPESPKGKQRLGYIGENLEVPWVELVEEWLGIKVSLHFEKPARLWRFPVETVQNSEAGFEKSYQCSNVTASWKLRLEPADTWRVSMSLECVET